MATSGQTLNDRINAARYALAGQGLARCVCKATTEEIIGPKKKHLDYLVACTHEPNVSIPQLANLLIERTNHIYWVVVFKALVTVHHLMSHGNERFIQYLASSNYSLELSTFLDKTAARDFSMSTFIRRYSRYINEKALSYRLLAFDFCKVKRGNEGVLRTMPIDRLLKTLPILQNQLDALLEFDCSASDLNNGVINACFMLLFRDLIGLFACHNDGIINLLNKYFTLNKKMCREAFELYKKFLVRMDKVSDFLSVAEIVGIDKDEIPDLRRTPCSIIDALEQHLQNLETNKKGLKQTNNNNTINQNNNTSIKTNTGNKSITGGEFTLLTNPNSSTGRSSPSNLAAGGTSSKSTEGNASTITDELTSNGLKDDEVRWALEEEARVLSSYGSIEGSKSKSHQLRASSAASSSSSATTPSRDNNSPKFATAAPPATITIEDIFGDADSFVPGSQTKKKHGLAPVGSATTALDNLSNTSSSSGNANRQSHPDIDSIKSAIKSATSTLEMVNNNKAGPGSKKASDDLFSLLDSSAAASTNAQSSLQQTKPTSLNSNISTNPISPLMNSPFDLPSMNGSNQNPMKPGNPFPGAPLQPINPTNGNQMFASGNRPNYTNLGGLEGFGDVLQPISATSKSSNLINSGGTATSKPNFNASSSTGLFKGDLDSTLANLAQNLTFEGVNKNKK